MSAKGTIRRFAGLLAIAARLDLGWLLRDTKYALAAITADILSSISAVAGIYLTALRFGGIGGMSADEVLFMLAYSTVVSGLFDLFGTSNNLHISRIIGRGQLEHLFMQPLPIPVQLVTSGFAPFTGGSTFLVGCILLSVAAKRLALYVTVRWLFLLLIAVLSTVAIVTAQSYLASSAAFYSPAAAEEISSTVVEGTWQLGVFPLSGMPLAVQLPLLTILPQGLTAWFPALWLLGKPPLGLPGLYLPAFALLLSVIAGYFFRKGLRYYVTKGSGRYVPYGFRS